MTTDVIIVGCFLLIFFTISLFFVYPKKGSKNECIIHCLIHLVISGILYSFSIPTYSKFNEPRRSVKSCFNNQNKIIDALKKYYSDNNLSFPDSCDEFNFKSEFIGKLEKYTKEFDKFWCNDCTFKISDSNFYCLEHGSIDEKSPFYTQGYPIKSYKEILKRKELKKKAREEMESRAKYYPILASYGFLCALKFFIFIFVV